MVWHGFTQMAAYPDNTPVIVERAEGRELIDVDGHRYFDAISSLWVTTLGHRVPELDAAVVDQLGKVAHATLLGNGSRAVDRVRRGAGRGGAGGRTPRAVRLRRCGGRGAGAQDRLPVLGEPGRARARTSSWPWATPTTATPSAPCRWATEGSAPPCSTRCGSPWSGPRATPRPTGRTRLVGCIEAQAGIAGRRRSSSPWCRGPRASWWPNPRTWPGGRGLPGPRGAAHLRRGGHRLRPDRPALRLGVGRTGVPARPALPGQGHHRRVPPAVGHRGLRCGLRGLRRPRPRRRDLLPRPLLRGERPGLRRGPPAPPADGRVGRAGQRGQVGRPAVATGSTGPWPGRPGWARSASGA